MKTEINLFKSLELETPRIANKNKALLISMGVAAFASVISMIIVTVISLSSSANIKRLTAILDAPDVKAMLVEDAGYKQEIISYEKDLAMLSQLDIEINQKQGFLTDQFHIIDNVRPDGVIIKTIGYSNLVLSITCETDAGNNPADFAKEVESTNAFEKVTYRGFSETNNNSAAIGFVLECTLLPLADDTSPAV